ncbi:MAG: hypothetical protein EA373_11205 [Oceanospirillales bacterium]|jgi:hypothetical protein|nr:MAG: hypothetical protein EA373_11205 [Oceanospirillales bacterium]
MNRIFKNTFLFLILSAILLLTGCASSPPPARAHDNICEIIAHDPSWYRAAKKSESRWGTPVSIQIAFVRQESSFVHNARPPRPTLFGFIPMPRKSSAFGYAQAQDGTWDDYRRATGNRLARRTNIDDALDFIGWYNSISNQRNGVALTDAFNLYLNYHEGHTGFRNRTYNNKPWLINVARTVESRARTYESQLPNCRLPSRLCIWPFC